MHVGEDFAQLHFLLWNRETFEVTEKEGKLVARGICDNKAELIARICLDLVVKHFPATLEPFAARHPWQVLIELSDTLSAAGLEERLAQVLEKAIENELARDAVIATSQTQAQALWNIREHIPLAEKLEGKKIAK